MVIKARRRRKALKRAGAKGARPRPAAVKKVARPIERVIKLPQSVAARKENETLIISAAGKELRREFSDPVIKIDFAEADGQQVVKIVAPIDGRAQRAIAGTWASHIKNMVAGVTKGYEYRMKIVYSHFPITVKVVGDEVKVSNFMGEKGDRAAKIIGPTKVEAQKEIITVSGPDIEAVGQTCSNIEKATRLTRFDRRRFPDGIYIMQRGVKGEA